MRRRERGSLRAPRIDERSASRSAYDGLDGVQPPHADRRSRRRRASWTRASASTSTRACAGTLDEHRVTVACDNERRRSRPIGYATCARRCRAASSAGGSQARARFTQLERDLQRVARPLAGRPGDDDERDRAHGPYPYAGVPWFSTVFGRDALIVGRQTAVGPAGARQGRAGPTWRRARPTVDDPGNDAQPGKILHEMRHGEMAGAEEIPFAPLLRQPRRDAALRRPGRCLLPADGGPGLHRAAVAERRARAGLDGRSGRPRRRRFHRVRATHVERAHPPGLEGLARRDLPRRWRPGRWDRSRCARSRPTPTPPGWAPPSWPMPSATTAAHPSCAPRPLRSAQRFEEAFWLEELGTYAHRARRRQAAAPSADLEPRPLPRQRHRAARSAPRGGDDADGAMRSFSGWGVRTRGRRRAPLQPDVVPQRIDLAARQRHGGAGAGTRTATTTHAARIMGGLFEASRHFELMRLPELFCGFTPPRRGRRRRCYPVACSPQAWASGALFMLLQACLGHGGRRLASTRFALRPRRLPSFLDHLRHREPAGRASDRSTSTSSASGSGSGVNIIRREGEVEVSDAQVSADDRDADALLRVAHAVAGRDRSDRARPLRGRADRHRQARPHARHPGRHRDRDAAARADRRCVPVAHRRRRGVRHRRRTPATAAGSSIPSTRPTTSCAASRCSPRSSPSSATASSRSASSRRRPCTAAGGRPAAGERTSASTAPSARSTSPRSTRWTKAQILFSTLRGLDAAGLGDGLHRRTDLRVLARSRLRRLLGPHAGGPGLGGGDARVRRQAVGHGRAACHRDRGGRPDDRSGGPPVVVRPAGADSRTALLHDQVLELLEAPMSLDAGATARGAPSP